MNLQELPDEIILRIISYLPQQDKLNLLYTNYDFYVLAQQKLYENLLFSISTALKCPDSFEESHYTVVGGVETPLATASLNKRIYETRQEILLEAITVNKELCKYIKKIAIIGEYNHNGTTSSFDDMINTQLLSYLCENCQFLVKITSNNLIFPNLTTRSLTSVQLSSLKYLEMIKFQQLKSLEFSLSEEIHDLDAYTDTELINIFKKLETLAFYDEISQSLISKRLQRIKGFQFSNLQDLKLLYYHNFDDPYTEIINFFKFIDFAKLKSVELTIGCNDITCDCIARFTKYLIERNINVTKLALIQKTIHRDHNYTEAFDMHVTEFLKALPNRLNLKELHISHAPPVDFNVNFGFEGNYLHRKSLFEAVLPLLSSLETFNCPSFMQSIACYEQLISDLLWNGCKCPHCDDYLPIFDKYILNHKYYDEVKSHLTDMISPILIGNAAAVLSKRGNTQKLTGWWSMPMLNRFWDFHSAPYQITHLSDCQMDKSAFRPLIKCIAHFLQAYVEAIGNMIPTLKRCVLSGVTFNRMDEMWHCFES